MIFVLPTTTPAPHPLLRPSSTLASLSPLFALFCFVVVYGSHFVGCSSHVCRQALCMCVCVSEWVWFRCRCIWVSVCESYWIAFFAAVVVVVTVAVAVAVVVVSVAVPLLRLLTRVRVTSDISAELCRQDGRQILIWFIAACTFLYAATATSTAATATSAARAAAATMSNQCHQITKH